MTSRTFHVAAMTSLALVLTSPSTATAANEIEVRAYDANRSEILIFGVFPKTYAAGAPIEITSITDCTRYLTIRSLVQPVASVGRIRLQRNGEPGCVPAM